MTVEERAKTVTDEVGTATTGAELRALIEKALRDQIEESAQLVIAESLRLGAFVLEFKRKDDMPAAMRFAGTVATLEKLIRQIRKRAESPPLEARIAKACDKVLDGLEDR